jgi:hypothetical protein
MKRLLIADGHNLLFQMFFGMPSRFERFEERARECETANNCKVMRMEDGQALFMNDSGGCMI